MCSSIFVIDSNIRGILWNKTSYEGKKFFENFQTNLLIQVASIINRSFNSNAIPFYSYIFGEILKKINEYKPIDKNETGTIYERIIYV